MSIIESKLNYQPLGDLNTWFDFEYEEISLDESLLILKEYLDNEQTIISLWNNSIFPDIYNLSNKKKHYDLLLKNINNNSFYSELYKNAFPLIDTVSGLPFILSNNCINLDTLSMMNHELDIFDTYFYRGVLNKTIDKKDFFSVKPNYLFKHSSIDLFNEHDHEKVLLNSIPEYRVQSYEDLITTVSNISDSLTKIKYFKKLWFRGQKQEYLIDRDSSLFNEILPEGLGGKQPSLIPSLGRYYIKNPEQEGLALIRNQWVKPFLVWIMLNKSHLFENAPKMFQRIKQCLIIDNDDEFSNILFNLEHYNIGKKSTKEPIAEELSDLVQNFYHEYKFKEFIFILQQYGYITSGLDVTWDIDTALFFTQAEFIKNEYQIIEPTLKMKRVIYIFAESKNSNSFHDNRNVFNKFYNEDLVPLRIRNQRSGIMGGSSIFSQNIYAYKVVAKIFIEGTEIKTARTVNDMFPNFNDDLYKVLSDTIPTPEGFY